MIDWIDWVDVTGLSDNYQVEMNVGTSKLRHRRMPFGEWNGRHGGFGSSPGLERDWTYGPPPSGTHAAKDSEGKPVGKRIYLATSWRNEHYGRILQLLRDQGHDVYDFQDKSFKFAELADKPWDTLTFMEQYALLEDDRSRAAYEKDKDGLDSSDILVMLYPCGNDAHTELGYAAGRGMYTIVYIMEGYKVGLMDKVTDKFVFADDQLLQELR